MPCGAGYLVHLTQESCHPRFAIDAARSNSATRGAVERAMATAFDEIVEKDGRGVKAGMGLN